jgi:hypothetical protein
VAWELFAQRWSAVADAAHAGNRRWFNAAWWCGGLTAALGMTLLGTSFIGAVTSTRLYWWVPSFLLIGLLSMAVTTVSAQATAWTSRAPFPWRLYRTIAAAEAQIFRARLHCEHADTIERFALDGTRDIERVLRHRYGRRLTAISVRTAARAWDEQVEALAAIRAMRLQSGNQTPTLTWFDNYIETVVAATYVAGPIRVHGEAPARLPRDRVQLPALALWAITAGLLAVGLVTSPDAATMLKGADWEGIGRGVTIFGGIVAAIATIVGLFRRRTASNV